MSQLIRWKTCYVISQTVVKLCSAKNERVSRFKRVFLNPAPLARHRDAVLHPAGSTTGRYYQENRLAHLPAHVLDVNQVAGRRREGCPGTPAACLFQNDDGWLHAGMGSTQTPGTSSFGGPDHAHGQGWTSMNLTIVVECCGNYDQDASKLLILWRPRRDLNPCYRRERAMS